VTTAIHYPLAITQQPAYRDLEHAPCDASEAWAGQCISVPCFPEMTDAEIDQVCGVLAAVSG
jgi:dTDP-4-amino-4,6-dideoxygalactose transaminase